LSGSPCKQKPAPMSTKSIPAPKRGRLPSGVRVVVVFTGATATSYAERRDAKPTLIRISPVNSAVFNLFILITFCGRDQVYSAVASI
jgi:hypothetical protein